MGHRANYAIRRDGVVELYYSHWGALSVPEDFFWGPSYAEAFIRTHSPADPNEDWLDDAWGEGGVALDFDDRVVTLFGGEALGHPPLRPTFVTLMQALWGVDSWRVEWADAGMPSIAAAVGFDPSVATSEPIPPFAVDLDKLGESFETAEPTFGCLLTIVREGETHHRVADAGVASTLYAGPDLLDHLDQTIDLARAEELWEIPDYRSQCWGLGDELAHSAIIDRDKQTIAFRDAFAERATTAFLAEKWQGWDVKQFRGTIDDHFARVGEVAPASLELLEKDRSDPWEVELSEEAALAEVAKYLIDSDRKDPAAIVRQLQAESLARGADAWVHPEATRTTPDVPLDGALRQDLFGRALALMK